MCYECFGQNVLLLMEHASASIMGSCRLATCPRVVSLIVRCWSCWSGAVSPRSGRGKHGRRCGVGLEKACRGLARGERVVDGEITCEKMRCTCTFFPTVNNIQQQSRSRELSQTWMLFLSGCAVRFALCNEVGPEEGNGWSTLRK